MRKRFYQYLIALIMLALVACGAPGDFGDPNGSGGSDSSASSAGDGPSVVGGGIGGTGTGASIGGTGTGVITDVGNAITLNNTGTFEIHAGTIISMDGREIGETGLREAGLGVVANVIAESDVDVDFTSGTAISIQLRQLVIGPVTGMEPLRVLGQTVLTTNDTVLPGGLDPDALTVGDIVRVSGYAGSSNAIQATRMELVPDGVSAWMLVGPVRGLDASGFSIGSQRVNLNGVTGGTVTASGCGDGLQEGNVVRVDAASDTDFVIRSNAAYSGHINSNDNSGAALETVTNVACISSGLPFAESSAASELVAQAEGLVTEEVLPQFALQGQQVMVTPGTVWVGGQREDVRLNVRVEAQGVLNMDSGVLTAGVVTFRDNRMRIRAPLTYGVTGGMQVLGMGILATPSTEDSDKILSGNRQHLQVDVWGFVDGYGQIYVTRISGMGSGDDGAVRLRGQVTHAASPVLHVLGINVDTTGMLLLDAGGQAIGLTEFFRLIREGSAVEVTDARYDGAHTILSNGSGYTKARILP